MSHFVAVLLDEIDRVKKALRDDSTLARARLTIEAEGRMDGEWNVTFAIGEYGEDVKGNSFTACVNEFLRRRGWAARHAAICLPNVAAGSGRVATWPGGRVATWPGSEEDEASDMLEEDNDDRLTT